MKLLRHRWVNLSSVSLSVAVVSLFSGAALDLLRRPSLAFYVVGVVLAAQPIFSLLVGGKAKVAWAKARRDGSRRGLAPVPRDASAPEPAWVTREDSRTTRPITATWTPLDLFRETSSPFLPWRSDYVSTFAGKGNESSVADRPSRRAIKAEAPVPDRASHRTLAAAQAVSALRDGEEVPVELTDPDEALRLALRLAIDHGQWDRVRVMTDLLANASVGPVRHAAPPMAAHKGGRQRPTLVSQ
jgi:hypothetical protein